MMSTQAQLSIVAVQCTPREKVKSLRSGPRVGTLPGSPGVKIWKPGPCFRKVITPTRNGLSFIVSEIRTGSSVTGDAVWNTPWHPAMAARSAAASSRSAPRSSSRSAAPGSARRCAFFASSASPKRTKGFTV